MDLMEAFANVTKDTNWMKKIAIGGGLLLLSVIAEIISIFLFESSTGFMWSIIPFIISVITVLYPTGFIFSTLRKQINENTDLMTDWTEKNMLLSGFKSCLSMILILGVFMIAGTAITLIGSFSISSLFKNSSALGWILFVLLIVILLLYFLFIYLIFPISLVCFGKTFKISSSVNFKKIFAIFKENQKEVWILFAWGIVFCAIYSIVLTMFCITVIGIIAFPFLYFYFFIVCINLLAQFAREIDINKYL